MTTGKQLKNAIRGAGITQEDVAIALNVSRQTVNSWLSKAIVPEDILQNVKTKLGIEIASFNPDVLKSKSDTDNVRPITPKLIDYNKPIPVYEQPMAASGVHIYNDEPDVKPAFNVIVPQFADCDFAKMVFGESMHPTYRNASYVFLKKQSKKYILWGEVYYIETADFNILKRLQRGDNEGQVLAESDNSELRPNGKRKYEPITLNIDDITGLYLAKGDFNKNQT